MIDLKPIIERVRVLVEQDTDQSLTYAALECRLAIEKICYDRLRMAHDYISHAHLKKWQPAAVVSTLIVEVDPHVTTTRTLSMSREPTNPDGPVVLPDEDYIQIGTQIGFDSKKLGSLWNALSGVALHVRLPRSKTDEIPAYGNKVQIKAKVMEALREMERLASSTMSLGAFGPEVSFTCACGTLNKRKVWQLKQGQIVICVNPDCDESFSVSLRDSNVFFKPQMSDFECSCGVKTSVPHRTFQKMKTDVVSAIECPGCKRMNRFMWQMTHAKPSDD